MSPSSLKPILLKLPLFLFAGLFLFQFWLIQKHAVNLPYMDEWGLMYGNNHPAAINLRWLYEQVNDHRTTTTKLFVWLQYHLNGWNLKTHQIISYFIFGATLLSLILFARKFVPQVPNWIVLGFLIFFLSPIIWIDHVNAYAVAIHFWLLFLILSAYFLFDKTQSWKVLLIATACSGLSMYSFAAGFVTSLVLLIVFVLFKVTRIAGATKGRDSAMPPDVRKRSALPSSCIKDQGLRPRELGGAQESSDKVAGRPKAFRTSGGGAAQPERQRELLQLVFVVAAIGGGLVVWIIGYHKPVYVGPIVLPHRMAFWSFFLNLLSFSFGVDRLSRSIGALCLFLIVCPMLIEIWNRKGRLTTLSNGQWAVFGLTLAILADLAAITLGRISFSLPWSKVSEYPEHGMPLIMLAALSWSMLLRDRKKWRNAFLAGFWIFCVLTFSNNWDFAIYARTGAERAANYQCVQAYYERRGDGHCRGTFADYPYPQTILEHARRLNISFYREMNRNPLVRTGSDTPRSDVYFGAFEAGCQQIRGWAYDPSKPDATIDVSIYDGDSLLTTLHANLPRPDANALGHGDKNYGFEYATPASLRDSRAHTISVRFAAGGEEFRNSPITLKCEAHGSPP
jgi:hypothetical protein